MQDLNRMITAFETTIGWIESLCEYSPSETVPLPKIDPNGGIRNKTLNDNILFLLVSI